jgi:hypothetical protein
MMKFFQMTLIAVACGMLGALFSMNPSMTLRAASVAAPAPVMPQAESVGGLLVISGDSFDDGDYLVMISKRGTELSLNPIQNIVGLDGKPAEGVLPPTDSDPDVPDPILNSALEKVRESFEADGKLAVFKQQVTLLKVVLEIPDSFGTRPLAWNHVNGILEKVLGEYASPYWDAWLLPLIDALEDTDDFDTFKKIVSEASASLDGA